MFRPKNFRKRLFAGGPPANKNLFAGGPPANKKLFTGGPPANKKLFSGGPPANKKLFAGGPPSNKKLFAGALSLLCSPEWSHAVLFSLALYCITVWYCTVFKGHLKDYVLLYCPLWFCMVVQCLGWAFLVVCGP